MKNTAILAAGFALMTAPAWAGPADNPGAEHRPEGKPPAQQDNPGSEHRPSDPGPKASLPAKAKAYGRYCRGESKQHVEGEKGTAFSRCVTAMAKLGAEKTDSPAKACKGTSRKHVKGEKGTPYSRCVKAAAKLLKDRDEDEGTT